MKKLAIMTLAAGVAAAVLVGGCRTGQSDEKLINTTMADWKTAMLAKDLDKVMAAYSENYSSNRGTGKDSVRQFMSRAFERGFTDNTKVELEEAKTTIENNKATFGPVKFVSDRGTFTMEYTLQKENGAWHIVGSKRLEQ